MNLVHANLIAVQDAGVLIRGPSGCGKSQLCLRLINERATKATLVADDQVLLHTKNNRLIGAPPQVLAGKLEIRGLGIIEQSYLPEVEVKLVVDLVAQSQISRMPEAHELSVEILNIKLAHFCLDPGSPAAVAILAAALDFFKLR